MSNFEKRAYIQRRQKIDIYLRKAFFLLEEVQGLLILRAITIIYIKKFMQFLNIIWNHYLYK